MFSLLKEACVMMHVSSLLNVINQMSRNVAFMFYHEIMDEQFRIILKEV